MAVTVTVPDMSCDGCEEIVEGAVSDVAGVESVEADQDEELVTVEGEVDVDAITDAIDFAGYSPGEARVGDDAETDTEDEDDEESGDEGSKEDGEADAEVDEEVNEEVDREEDEEEDEEVQADD